MSSYTVPDDNIEIDIENKNVHHSLNPIKIVKLLPMLTQYCSDIVDVTIK